jgi:hypothetical protein
MSGRMSPAKLTVGHLRWPVGIGCPTVLVWHIQHNCHRFVLPLPAPKGGQCPRFNSEAIPESMSPAGGACPDLSGGWG